MSWIGYLMKSLVWLREYNRDDVKFDQLVIQKQHWENWLLKQSPLRLNYQINRGIKMRVKKRLSTILIIVALLICTYAGYLGIIRYSNDYLL